jgi:hypothetical protein
MSDEQYRTNAEDCLRKARSAGNDPSRPFWLNLAQHWLQLAEQRSRKDAARETTAGSER